MKIGVIIPSDKEYTAQQLLAELLRDAGSMERALVIYQLGDEVKFAYSRMTGAELAVFALLLQHEAYDRLAP